MPGDLQPLGNGQQIVNPDGTPNEYFIRWAQTRQINIGEAIDAAQAQQLIDDWAVGRTITAGTGLDGGGTLAADITIDLADTAVTPGTYGDATNVAQITVDPQGRITAVVDVPISGGGGGGGYTPMPEPRFATTGNVGLGASNFVMTQCYVSEACTITDLTVTFDSATAGLSLFAGVYGENATTHTTTALLGQSAASTTVVGNSVVTFTFASPIVLAAGIYIWVGLGLFGAGSTTHYTIPFNLVRRFFGIASTTLPGTAPGVSQDTWNGFSWWLTTA